MAGYLYRDSTFLSFYQYLHQIGLNCPVFRIKRGFSDSHLSFPSRCSIYPYPPPKSVRLRAHTPGSLLLCHTAMPMQARASCVFLFIFETRLHCHLTQCGFGVRLQVLVPICSHPALRDKLCSPRTGAPGGDLFSVYEPRAIRFQSYPIIESKNQASEPPIINWRSELMIFVQIRLGERQVCLDHLHS